MGYTVIAPEGDNMTALFAGMKHFPTERVILLTTPKGVKSAKKIEKKLEEFTVKVTIREIDGHPLEEVFKAFAEICSTYDNDTLLVNVATGDHGMTCAALSAAYANGLKAIDVMGDQIILLPIMKLSYYKEISDNKLELLKSLSTEKYISLQELSKKMKMSVSLLSYHLNGNYKHKGLKDHRLVDLKSENKNLYVKLSSAGNLLLKGYVKNCC